MPPSSSNYSELAFDHSHPFAQSRNRRILKQGQARGQDVRRNRFRGRQKLVETRLVQIASPRTTREGQRSPTISRVHATGRVRSPYFSWQKLPFSLAGYKDLTSCVMQLNWAGPSRGEQEPARSGQIPRIVSGVPLSADLAGAHACDNVAPLGEMSLAVAWQTVLLLAVRQDRLRRRSRLIQWAPPG